MKIAIIQMNPTVGDLVGNTQKIIHYINEYSSQCELMVLPEMVLTGYPPQDLLFESKFITQVQKAVEQIATAVNGTAVIFGTVRSENHQSFNSAAIIKQGGHIEYRDKSLLPTYDVFDELRYFAPSSEIVPVRIDGRKIGVQICEDLWDDDYDIKVTQTLQDKGAELIVNISASPFHVDRFQRRLLIIKDKVESTNIPFVYCNLVGAQDELVFDGQSAVINRGGKLIACGQAFTEEVIIVDTESKKVVEPPSTVEAEQLFKALSLGVKDYFVKTGHNLAVLGLSGGIDSALTAAIAAEALGADNVLGIAMPSVYSSDHSVSDAELLAENLDIQFEILPIKEINENFLDILQPVFQNSEAGLAEENLQARIRGNLLMAVANKKNALVLNTGNKTETALGYCTMYGDMCGALAVISDLNKAQVYDLCRWINAHRNTQIIPDGTLTKPPSAELRPEQVDPFDYDKISPLLDAIVTEGKHTSSLIKDGYDESLSKEMMQKVRLAEYKRRQAAPGIRVSSKAFGIGRRYPIVNRFKE